MNTSEKNNLLIEMTELCQILKTKDPRTAIKWCEDNKIPILFVAKKRMVHRFLVEMEIDKTIIEMLKNKYPQKWEELYKCYQSKDKLGYISMLEIDSKNTKNEKLFIEPKSELAKEFSNEL